MRRGLWTLVDFLVIVGEEMLEKSTIKDKSCGEEGRDVDGEVWEGEVECYVVSVEGGLFVWEETKHGTE